MTKYYRWYEDLSDKEESILQLTDFELGGLEEWELREGKKITHWHSGNAAYYEDDGVAYDLLNTTIQVHVISDRLKSFLDSLNLFEVQYLPLRIQKKNSDVALDNYHILNVSHRVSCLDREQSDYLVWGNARSDRSPDDLRDLRKAVIIPSMIDTCKIFRLSEWEVYLIVEEQIRNIILENGLTGSLFKEIDLAA